jgi:hypothetical protein
MLPPATSRTVWIRCSACRQFFREGDDQLRVDHHVAAGDQPDRLDQVFGVAGLQDIAASAGANGFDHELPVVVRGQNDDADLRMPNPDPPCGLEPVHLRHADVEQDDVRLSRAVVDHPKDLGAVGGLTEDLDVAGHFQIATQTLADQGMVVRDHHADRHATFSIGVPRPGLKPHCAARRGHGARPPNVMRASRGPRQNT